tara:strand:+ start:747 stop:1427 length:681 start_codon:yes stop_codon:yes gene_type:complete
MAITLSTDGYCEASDVAALLQSLTIDASSDPSTTEVEGFITEYFGELGGMLVGANYVHPVSQSGGSLTVSGGGSIVTKDAAYAGNTWLTFQGSGGTISGIVRQGDSFTLGAAQRYGVLRWAEVSDAGDMAVEFAPGLEADASASSTVTYTSGAGAANVLKHLNALGVAVKTVMAAYGPDADEAILGPVRDERDRLYGGIKDRSIILLGADRMDTTRTAGTAKLMRS